MFTFREERRGGRAGCFSASRLAESSAAGFKSSMLSKRLAHEGQILGFRERDFPPSAIGSQQQMQMIGFNFVKHHCNNPAYQEKFGNTLVQFLVNNAHVIFCNTFAMQYAKKSRFAVLFTAINTARSACFRDDHLGQLRQFRLQFFPDPDRDVFARRIFEPGNFVKIVMVQFFPDRPERLRNVRVIHHPAELRVAFAGDDDLRLETVTMQTPAFVRLGQMRQQMRRLELKCFA